MKILSSSHNTTHHRLKNANTTFKKSRATTIKTFDTTEERKKKINEVFNAVGISVRCVMLIDL